MDTNTCPYCKQPIPPDARKCPYCREWVDRKARLLRVLWIIPFLAFLLFMPEIMERTSFREQKFSQHPDAIKILSHEAGQGEDGGLCVLGTMENVSETPWDSITVQVDYFDAKDKLVDTSQDWESDTLAPDQERAFKVTFEKKRQGVQYDHYRIFIAGADDASRF
jgi:predicted nucleic acid-binding Zn ribbon protein